MLRPWIATEVTGLKGVKDTVFEPSIQHAVPLKPHTPIEWINIKSESCDTFIANSVTEFDNFPLPGQQMNYA